MVLGLFDRIEDAEIALNNLLEADFPSKNILVIVKDKNIFEQIVKKEDFPYKKFTKGFSLSLAKRGATNINNYQKEVESGKVLIILDFVEGEEEDAKEILQDQNAKNVELI